MENQVLHTGLCDVIFPGEAAGETLKLITLGSESLKKPNSRNLKDSEVCFVPLYGWHSPASAFPSRKSSVESTNSSSPGRAL